MDYTKLGAWPGLRWAGVAGLYANLAPEGIVSAPLPALDLGFEGIAGERHGGEVTPANARKPWYPPGSPVRNTRQVSVLAAAEIEAIAARLGLPAVEPEWLGANIVLDGIDDVTALPAGTRLLFEHGVGLVGDGENMPCIHAGREVALGSDGPRELARRFVRAAHGRRGITAWVEAAGTVRVGERVALAPPPSWSLAPRAAQPA